jgi:hypothetical protein
VKAGQDFFAHKTKKDPSLAQDEFTSVLHYRSFALLRMNSPQFCTEVNSIDDH